MATGEAAPAVAGGLLLPEDGWPNGAPKIWVAARAPLCGIACAACAGTAGFAVEALFAVKTEPQRVH